ncbi:MAG: purine-nucleoside phosphorylase [Gracilibacteraceae bacterium]|nr:purine-nucleoside phosphorylase [Gracilibacteraceae bacterium]
MQKNLLSVINEAGSFLLEREGAAPRIALILGSGLGELAEEAEDKRVIEYKEIPGFPVSTVQGHKGRLVFGKMGGKRVVFMQGRFHYYEGYNMKEVAFPIWVFNFLGIKKLIVTNAAGGINTSFKPGDLMIIKDHINYTNNNPLIGPNLEALGPRFPDMSAAYSNELIEIVRECAYSNGIRLQEGNYLFLTGPSYETPAEIRAFRILGADAVGMSTVPEVLAANHCGIETVGISCITNMAAGILDAPLNHKEVMETAERVKGDFSKLIKSVVEKMEV